MIPYKTLELPGVRFPVIASPLFTGTRVLTLPRILAQELDFYCRDSDSCVPVDTDLQMLRNHHFRQSLAHWCPPYLDGVVVCPTMSVHEKAYGVPRFTYYIYDRWRWTAQPYHERLAETADVIRGCRTEGFDMAVPEWRECPDDDSLCSYMTHVVARGHEGLVIHGKFSPYKYGRVSPLEKWLVEWRSGKKGENNENTQNNPQDTTSRVSAS